MKKQFTLPLSVILALSAILTPLPTLGKPLDCNSKNINSISDIHVCSSPELRELNQELNRLSENDETQKIQEAYNSRISQLTDQIRKTADPALKEKYTADYQKLSAEMKRKLKTAEAEENYVESWLQEKENSRKKCRNEKCIADNYKQTLAELKNYRNGYGCEKLNFLPECEIYFYNKDNPRTVSEVLLTKGQNTYKDKLTVNLPGKCVYLFVSAYYPAVWDIVVSKETQLEAIIATGDEPQMVRGFPEGTTVINHNQKELLKNSQNCFNAFYRDEQTIRKKFENLGITPQNVQITTNNQIGSNTEISNYLYNPMQINGKEIKTDLFPEDKGWYQLERAGKIRRATSADIKHFKKTGIINLDNSEFIWDQSKYASLYQYEHDILRQGYIVLENIDKFPSSRNRNMNTLFIPEDIKVPDNLFMSPIFAGNGIQSMFNKVYMIKAPIKEVKKW